MVSRRQRQRRTTQAAWAIACGIYTAAGVAGGLAMSCATAVLLRALIGGAP